MSSKVQDKHCEEQNKRLAYLDHNVLDLMTKGDPHDVKSILTKSNLTPIYSFETFKEIKRSKGYESIFLDVLAEIGAERIRPLLDKNFIDTGKAAVGRFDPHEEYQRYCTNLEETPESDFGMSKMLKKMYGGQEEISFLDIVKNGHEDLTRYLENTIQSAMDEIDALLSDCDPTKAILIEQISSAIPELDPKIKATTLDMDNHLVSVAALENAMNISPKILNNIKPPNVVKQIMDLVVKRIAKHDVEIDIEMEAYWGIKPYPLDKRFPYGIGQAQQVSNIYHMLNFLGYYRDSKMKRDRRFIASLSDMTHAGLASFCDYFFCRDNSLVLKSAAAYEYLNVGTQIIHFQDKKLVYD